MARPISEAQRAACQQNAKQSTGPRTAAGKAKSKLNAVKHGLTAQLPVLAFEDDAEFQALKDGFEADFAPQNTYQRFLVHQLATHAWRILRSQHVEVGLHELQLKQTLHRLQAKGHQTGQALEQNPYQGLALTLYPPQDDPHNQLHRNFFRYARDIQSAFYRAQKALAEAIKPNAPKPVKSTTPRFVSSGAPAGRPATVTQPVTPPVPPLQQTPPSDIVGEVQPPAS